MAKRDWVALTKDEEVKIIGDVRKAKPYAYVDLSIAEAIGVALREKNSGRVPDREDQEMRSVIERVLEGFDNVDSRIDTWSKTVTNHHIKIHELEDRLMNSNKTIEAQNKKILELEAKSGDCSKMFMNISVKINEMEERLNKHSGNFTEIVKKDHILTDILTEAFKIIDENQANDHAYLDKVHDTLQKIIERLWGK